MKELVEMSGQISSHFWRQAKYLVHNQPGFDGQTQHESGIFLFNVLIDEELVKWWCKFLDDYSVLRSK